MSARWKPWAVVMLLAAAFAATALSARPFVKAGAFLLDLAGRDGLARGMLPIARADVAVEAVVIPTRHGPVAARIDRPLPAADRTVVVFPGVHGAGLDEPRLADFSSRLASTGVTVLTVALPDLRAFRITARSTDQIEDVTRWAATDGQFAPEGRVGLVGVSFAGGLALVAAGRPGLAGRLDLVLSIGGHGDLGRALRYLSTGDLPDGTRRAPHPYSVAVLTLTAVPYIVPASQAAQLEAGLLAWLEGSLDERPRSADGLRSRARDAARQMDEPARSVMEMVIDADVARLGRLIGPHVDALARDRDLSPEQSPATRVPVFLLHGSDDNVIPSSEASLLGAYLTREGNRNVHALLTPLISHVGLAATASIADNLRLLAFWRDLLEVWEH